MQDKVHGLTFKAWMVKVDAQLETVLGVGNESLDDFHYREWWEAGESPRDTAADCLERYELYDGADY